MSIACPRTILAGLFAGFLLLAASPTAASVTDHPLPGIVVMPSAHSFDALRVRLERAVTANGFAVVTRASASAGAAARGIEIPGNLVVGVFRNDYAIRMLEASLAAGIEAPLRFYLTENDDGTATLVYRTPSAAFRPYGVPTLDAMAVELDMIWEKIAREAVGE